MEQEYSVKEVYNEKGESAETILVQILNNYIINKLEK